MYGKMIFTLYGQAQGGIPMIHIISGAEWAGITIVMKKGLVPRPSRLIHYPSRIYVRGDWSTGREGAEWRLSVFDETYPRHLAPTLGVQKTKKPAVMAGFFVII